MYSHIYEIVRRRAASLPDAVAIGGQEGLAWKTLTGRELLDRIDRLAPELADLGVREGDRVVLWLPNAWRTPVYLFALWKLGAVVVPFDREMNPEAAAQIIDSVDARLVLVGSGERPPWAHGRSLTEWWEPGSVNEGARGGGGVGVQVEQGQESAPHPLIPSSPLPLSDWAPPAEELATISFTSGTTGHPKGCMLTHANFCFEVEALPATIRLDATCRLGSILPLSHVFELTCGLLYPLACGAAIHYIPSRRPPEILRVLREQRISHMLVVPQLLTLMGGALDRQLRDRLPRPLYGAMMAVAPRLPLAARRRLFWPAHRHLGGQLRVMGSAGAPLPAETQVLWERLGVRVVQGYGASETAPVIASGKEDGSTPVGSVGRALPGVEIRLTAEGEALARGPNVMRGYWQDAERTAEALADGWYHTGDLATLDERGNLRIVGRSRELIVLPSGMKVWPTDVEDVLRERPEVRDAAVMGISTAGAGLKLHAYLLPAGGASRAADLGALVAACNGRLARHQRLTTASWWPGDEFPRTALGKVRRHLLPPPAVGDTVPVEAALAADDPVAQAIAGVARATVTRPDQTLGGLGIDSFGLVDLALALEEKTGKAIGDGDLSLDMTVEQARAFVLTAPDVEAGAAGERLDAAEGGSAEAAEWPYTWGRHFRWLSLPIDGLYRFYVTRTTVLGAEYLTGLPERTILAGVHRSFTDMPLVYHALKRSPARGLARRLVVATAAVNFARYRGILTTWAALAFGLYPLRRLSERDVSLRSLERLAERGAAILIFPQGWHVPPELEQVDDPTARFRPGVAYLAEALGAAVVPFGLAGCERIVTPQIDEFTGRRVLGVPFALRHGPLAIAFGPPLCPAAGEPPAAFTVRLQTACYALARRAEAALNCPDADNSPCDSQARLS